MPIRSFGFTLMEIMLGLVILTAGMLGVYTMLKPASLKAGVEKESKQLSSLVRGLEGSFGATQGHYGNLNLSTASDLRLTGVNFEGTTLNSALGDNMLLRPARVREDNDAFDVVYQNIDAKKCTHYIKAFYPQSYTILVGSNQTPVQQTTGVNDGRLVSDDVILSACSTSEFDNKAGTVVFRFFEPRATALSSTDQVCGCTPETQNQTLPCGPGQIGGIQQQRTSTCTGGTGACPTAVWTTWSTTSNTCSGAPTPMSLAAAVAPSSTLCVSETENRVSSCPAGQTGYITESRTSTCATSTSTPAWGAWAVTKDTCTVPTSTAITCTPSTETQNLPCPVPQGGQITQTRSSTCSSSNATPVWGAWIETSRNCSIACVDTGTCCTPQPDQQRNVNCNAGYWGQTQENRSSYCSTYDAVMQWNPWQYLSGTCTACPAPSTATQTQWLSTSASTCPAGQYGSNGWEYEQSRTQTTTYNCPAGTLVLPAPTIGAWTAWSNTGNTRNNTSSCTNCPASTTQTETQWVNASGTCPAGQIGSITWEKEQSRTRTQSYSCPAGTSVLPAPSYTAWSGWGDTGATRNMVNSCAPAATDTCCSLNYSVVYMGTDPSGACSLRAVRTCDGTSEPLATLATAPYNQYIGWSYDINPSAMPSTTCRSAWNGFTFSMNKMKSEGIPMDGRGTSTCTPCSAPASTTTGITRSLANQNQDVGCPVGWSGNHWQTRTVTESGTRTTSWTCPGPTSSTSDSWSGSYSYGAWTTTSNTCAATCTPPASTNTAVTRNLANQNQTLTSACPAGYTGTVTTNQTRTVTENGTQTTSWSCPGPTSSTSTTWLGTYNYGAWTTTSTSDTCVASCSAPAPTSTAVTRNLANQNQTVACPVGQTGSITQTRTVTENGTQTTSWTCPGPTSSTSTTWHGTYNYGSWTTTSNTCVSMPQTGYWSFGSYGGPESACSGRDRYNETWVWEHVQLDGSLLTGNGSCENRDANLNNIECTGTASHRHGEFIGVSGLNFGFSDGMPNPRPSETVPLPPGSDCFVGDREEWIVCDGNTGNGIYVGEVLECTPF